MSDNDSPKTQLNAAIEAAKSGDKATARRLLETVINQEPENELAWIWLASTVNTLKERRLCLQRVLQINPNNARAREALAKLDARGSQASTDTNQAQQRVTSVLESSPRRTAAAHNAERTGATSRSSNVDPTNLVLYGMVIVGILGAMFLGSVLISPPAFLQAPTPTPLPPSATPTITLTPTPAFIRVTLAAADDSLPPTFTPTPTNTPTQTPQPSPTPFPLSEFDALFTSRGEVEVEPALYSMNGDGSGQQRIIDNVSDIVYSVSGRQVALVRVVDYVPDPEAEEDDFTETTSVSEIFVAPWDDLANSQQVTTLRLRSAHSPSFSPDGRLIVFVSDWESEDDELWLLDTETGITTRLTDNDNIDRDPDWSPTEENLIVFASDRDSPNLTEIYSMRLSFDPDVENVVTRLTDDQGSSYQPRFSPNGNRIAYVTDREGDGDIYTMSSDGQRPFLLTNDAGAEDRNPAWTPDGRWVAFASNREDELFQFYLVDVRGREVIRLTNDDREARSITFRPELLLRLQAEPD